MKLKSIRIKEIPCFSLKLRKQESRADTGKLRNLSSSEEQIKKEIFQAEISLRLRNLRLKSLKEISYKNPECIGKGVGKLFHFSFMTAEKSSST